MAIDAKTHNIYLPTAEFIPALEPTVEKSEAETSSNKDSFVILVIGK